MLTCIKSFGSKLATDVSAAAAQLHDPKNNNATSQQDTPRRLPEHAAGERDRVCGMTRRMS
ncbi:MAG: hypothetical protein HYY23_15860 [Verrucomicrobia bacterium]|nr:hypothetical protein [Verrucomicrobiota bacterium]